MGDLGKNETLFYHNTCLFVHRTLDLSAQDDVGTGVLWCRVGPLVGVRGSHYSNSRSASNESSEKGGKQQKKNDLLKITSSGACQVTDLL
jgi:hypothetical protein